MSSNPNYIDINRASWNNRLESHIQSDFYQQEAFLAGKSSLNPIELELLGNVAGKKILHLQCHFGQDSISLSRQGAQVTGVDLSDKAIQYAQQISNKENATAQFICCDIYDLPKYLDEQFDIIFTSYGTIGWLPDLNKWANLISHFLKPSGQFIFVEFHPFVWMYDDNFEQIAYRYFNSGPIVEVENGTYADKNANISQSYVMWNHSISEVLSSLLNAGLTLNTFQEFDYSPYNCFNKTETIAEGKYRIAHWGNKIPMVYALRALK